jgi:uncharacterized repeat protein (TIGR01451 family)
VAPLVVGYGPVVTKSVEGIPAEVGDQVTFMITVTNNGDQILEDVILTDPVLSFFDILQASTTKGRTSIDTDENVVTVTIGNLEPDEVVLLTIIVQVNDTVHFSAEVPNVADLTYGINGITQSEPSNTVCFRIEGISDRRFDGLRSPSSFGILSFGLIAILFCGYGIWKRSREEQDGRRYITIGVILLLIAIVLYVALVFLPSLAALRGPTFPECETAVRPASISEILTFPEMSESMANSVREVRIFQDMGDKAKKL